MEKEGIVLSVVVAVVGGVVSSEAGMAVAMNGQIGHCAFRRYGVSLNIC